ncbi:MAG: sigma-70 family RNA polymerase sigma factor [Desulfobacteraceae bacterium]|jgi:RNA polymerase sigma-70 factor (ECF subfamily)|nr:MAG: sigma-70 family RNA polymerase sigma factor [Desulfobacteraceae bacterium]
MHQETAVLRHEFDPIDRELIESFKAGSSEAMERLVERYENRIFTFGLKMCGHRQDAEDIAQETFLSAFRHLDRFRQETPLKNWLFKIAARACFRKRRKKKGEPDREISIESLRHEDGNGGDYFIPDPDESPHDAVLRLELKTIIDNSIRSLPPKYRMVFNLRDMEGFSTEEAAQIMGISIQLVKTRLHRARLFLRDKITAAYREGGLQ